MEFPKRCACGAVYERAEWLKLEWVGVQRDDEDGDLDLRNCKACGSTLAVLVVNVKAQGECIEAGCDKPAALFGRCAKHQDALRAELVRTQEPLRQAVDAIMSEGRRWRIS